MAREFVDFIAINNKLHATIGMLRHVIIFYNDPESRGRVPGTKMEG